MSNFKNIESWSNSAKKRFTKDFKVPINVYTTDIFIERMELYNVLYNVEEKFNIFQTLYEKYGESFIGKSHDIIGDLIERVKNTNGYKSFNEDPVPRITNYLQQEKLYHPDNTGKRFISIDINHANFNVMNNFDSSIFGECNSYNEFIDSCVESDYQDYFKNSKHIRQIIFGHLNPKRQRTYMKYIMNENFQSFKEHMAFMPSEDEVVIPYTDEVWASKDVAVACLHDVAGGMFSVEQFVLNQVVKSEKDMFVREYPDGTIKFTAVPVDVFAQAYKRYYKLTVGENDLLFYHNGKLCKYMDNCF